MHRSGGELAEGDLGEAGVGVGGEGVAVGWGGADQRVEGGQVGQFLQDGESDLGWHAFQDAGRHGGGFLVWHG